MLQGKVARKGRMHRLLRQLEGWALGRADGILCVSERLRRRCRGWRPDAARKAVVIPCCYDPNLARRDDTTVEHLRIELGLDSTRDFVLVYAGSLSAWNRPDLILAAYHAVRAVHAGTKLLLLTGSATEARAIFGRETGVIIRSVAHADIQHYLALADLGLLLRDRSPVNRVASPVKFAEYLACGVPVLVSPGVGDCPGICGKRERWVRASIRSPIGAGGVRDSHATWHVSHAMPGRRGSILRRGSLSGLVQGFGHGSRKMRLSESVGAFPLEYE